MFCGSEALCYSIELCDFAIELFGSGIRDWVPEVIDNSMDVILEHSDHRLDRSDHGTHRLVFPFVEVGDGLIDGGTEGVHSFEVFSNPPGLSGLEMDGIEFVEPMQVPVGPALGVFQHEEAGMSQQWLGAYFVAPGPVNRVR